MTTDTPHDAATDVAEQRICAIGASAGGLAPVEEFFESIATDTGLVFVIVQHLSPDHESMMASLLGSKTAMPVQQATDGVRVLRNHVYLIPPGAELAIEGDVLVVRQRSSEPRHLHRPIDVFFSAMAREYGRRCVGVILSGTGSDGTAGAAEISRAGGLVLVQDESAAFGGMPDAAQQSGFVDAVMAPVELAGEVTRFAEGRMGGEPVGDEALSPIEERIFADLESLSGIDFSEYKPGTLRRRLERRVLLGNDTLESYQQRTMSDEAERMALVNDLLIDVTTFFRDKEVFDEIRHTVVPRLILEATSNSRPLRVWVPGCATGEEAYSLAMLLLDAMGNLYGQRPLLKIFATDVHERALADASEGRYSAEEIIGVPKDLRDKWFVRSGETYTPNEQLRSVITFAQHNLLRDAPFTNVDLVSCRNMLIYFRRPAQDRAISSLAFALRLGGNLVLGSSESLGPIESDFQVIDGAARIWEKTGDTHRRAYRPPTRLPTRRASSTHRAAPVTPDLKLLRSYDAVLASQFNGALLMSPHRELVHTIGTATAWLRQPAGRPTLDAIKMIGDQRLRLAITAALRELDGGARTSTPREVSLAFDPSIEVPTQALIAQQLAVGQETFYLAFTRPLEPAMISRDEVARTSPGLHTNDDVDQLESELAYVRDSLQSALEEQESSNEELNAANEELIASNEELQSTNEELSSVNEELRTLNDEHRSRLEQVRDLSADLEQLMASSDIGVVFLNEDHTIRRFNEPARDYFKVRDSDIDRPFEDVISLLDGADLEAAIAEVSSSGERRIRAAALHGEPDRRLAVQVHRYELPHDRWGVFISVIDVTEFAVTQEQRLLAEYLQSAPVAVAMWDNENRWVYANRGLGTSVASASLRGAHPADVYDDELAAKLVREIDDVRSLGEPITTYTTADASTSIEDYVSTKFTFDLDGTTHVGGLAILTKDLADLEELKLERSVLRAMAVGSVVEVRLHDRNLEPVQGLDVVAPGESVLESGLDEEVQQQLRDGRATALASGRVSRHRLQRRLDDGSTHWVRVEQMTYGGGEGVATIVIDDDEAQSEIHALRDEVADLKARLGRLATSSSVTTADLAQRNRDLDSFAHVAAHDLKAPIRSMRSFSELALSELPEGSPATSHVNQVLAASMRMGDLVDSLLDFATLGALDISGGQVTLDNLLGDVVADLRVQIDASQTALTVTGGDLVLHGNRDALRQMLSNLVNNSIKYRGDDAPVIALSATPDGGGVRVVIADNGIGFDPELADEMFEPFRRLHSKEVSGSGVGLAICQRIAEQLGGRIWATAEKGVGATFSVWLPSVVDLGTSTIADLSGAEEGVDQ